MAPLRLPQPGDPFIRAADVKALADELVRQGKLTYDEEGAEVQSGASGVHIARRRPVMELWARLTSEGTGQDAGRYAWIEQSRSAIGEFTDLQYGRVGTVTLDPAIEYNGATGLKTGGPGVGLIVRLRQGFAEPVQAGVKQEWLFLVGGAAEMTGVARVTTQLIDGYNVSHLGQGTFNTTTKTFPSSKRVLVLDAALITIPDSP